MLDQIQSCIEQYEVITIFHHINSDGDALGSQSGLATYLKHVYPDKQVYLLGEDNLSYPQFLKPDFVEDEVIKASLAIILDTANRSRIDDQRYTLAKQVIKIDHHVKVDDYADLNWSDELAASTCEMVAKLLFHMYKNTLPTDVAAYLYRGILTDTMRFSTTNTSSETLRIACELSKSNIDLNKINVEMFTTTQKMFHYANYVRSNTTIKDGVSYSFVDKDAIEKFDIPFDDAKRCISQIGGIEGVKIWVLFAQDSDNDLYGASIRSQKKYQINEIAMKYHGGGHKNASGVKGLTKDAAYCLLNDLIECAKGE